MNNRIRKMPLVLSLFTSTSALVCCALPALFVLLGAGAVFAGVVSAFPQLLWISEHKVPIFVAGGVLLALSGWLEFRGRGKACPPDPALAEACRSTRRWSVWVWGMSVVMYGIGGTVAFVLPLFLR